MGHRRCCARSPAHGARHAPCLVAIRDRRLLSGRNKLSRDAGSFEGRGVACCTCWLAWGARYAHAECCCEPDVPHVWEQDSGGSSPGAWADRRSCRAPGSHGLRSLRTSLSRRRPLLSPRRAGLPRELGFSCRLLERGTPIGCQPWRNQAPVSGCAWGSLGRSVVDRAFRELQHGVASLNPGFEHPDFPNVLQEQLRAHR